MVFWPIYNVLISGGTLWNNDKVIDYSLTNESIWNDDIIVE